MKSYAKMNQDNTDQMTLRMKKVNFNCLSWWLNFDNSFYEGFSLNMWISSGFVCLKFSFLNTLNFLYSMLMGCNEINDGQQFVLAFLFLSIFRIWFWRLGSWVKCQRRQFNCPWSSFQKPSNANQVPWDSTTWILTRTLDKLKFCYVQTLFWFGYNCNV